MQLVLGRLKYTPTYSTPLFTESSTSVDAGGRGLKASRDIPRGTPIFQETEFFSIWRDGNLPQSKIADPRFQGLRCPRRNATNQQRFDMNSFQINPDPDKRERRGIFLEAARFNHSCVPNAFFTWNAKLKSITIHAIVDIPEDEEIFINYLPEEFLNNKTNRRRILRESYGFNCGCPACRTGEFSRASEIRRTQMRELEDDLHANEHSDSARVRSEQHMRIKLFITLLQQEGLLYPHLADKYREEIDWYVEEMELTVDRSVAVGTASRLRSEAVHVAREMLFWDVISNGVESSAVTKTLKAIRDRKEM